MTTLLDEPVQRRAESSGGRLRASTAAIRLSFTWFGTRKTLTPQQKAQAADTFGAEGEFLSAGKKLIDTRHPDFKAVTERPRPDCLLLAGNQPALSGAGDPADPSGRHRTGQPAAHDAQGRPAGGGRPSRQPLRLRSSRPPASGWGASTTPADYPRVTSSGLFDVTWDFPSVEPPGYLQRLSPELYEQECRRVAAQFDEAVQLAEQAFLHELSQLVSHLTERLSGTEDGKPKVFRDSVVENLSEFFETVPPAQHPLQRPAR